MEPGSPRLTRLRKVGDRTAKADSTYEYDAAGRLVWAESAAGSQKNAYGDGLPRYIVHQEGVFRIHSDETQN